LAKFHRNILSLSEDIAKSFRGATFLTHTVHYGQNLAQLLSHYKSYTANNVLIISTVINVQTLKLS